MINNVIINKFGERFGFTDFSEMDISSAKACK